jgi:hypothetical protein
MRSILRLALAGLALLVSAWFALGWVQEHDTGRATALLARSQAPSPRAISQARSLLATAGTLNPDRQVDLDRGHVAFDLHEYPAAIRILKAVTQAEPQNVFAWIQLGYTAGGAGQIALAGVAGNHVAELVNKIKQP